MINSAMNDKMIRFTENFGIKNVVKGLDQAQRTFSNDKVDFSVSLESNEFENVNIEKMISPEFDVEANKGKLVAFDGSFGRFHYTQAYPVVKDGYRLWDKEGNPIQVENIFTDRTFGKVDSSNDFNEESAKELLNYGTNARIEGVFLPSHVRSSHSIPFQIPAQVQVHSINGRPVEEYLSK